VSPVAVGVMAGLGIQGYGLAIQALAHRASK
jgi:3-dehydroquinate dehydratase